jgi:hypothetical protein
VQKSKTVGSRRITSRSLIVLNLSRQDQIALARRYLARAWPSRVWRGHRMVIRGCVDSKGVGLGNPVMALTSALVRTLDARHAAWWYSLIAPFRIRRRSIGPGAAGMVGRVAFGGRWPRVRCGR